VYRLKLMTLLALFAAASLWAQDDEQEPGQAEQEEEAPAPEDTISDEEIDELLGLDEDYTEVDDEDFDPTESVRFGQSIPFPTDI
jgi:hypothetical protein